MSDSVAKLVEALIAYWSETLPSSAPIYSVTASFAAIALDAYTHREREQIKGDPHRYMAVIREAVDNLRQNDIEAMQLFRQFCAHSAESSSSHPQPPMQNISISRNEGNIMIAGRDIYTQAGKNITREGSKPARHPSQARETVQANIFISYRRSSSQDFVARLYEKLAPIVEGHIFWDTVSMRPGPFPEQIRTTIEHCQILLSIVQPGAIDTDRILQSDDWVRQEIEIALRTGKHIIPVFVDGYLPAEYQLPTSIRPLLSMHGIDFNRADFDSSIIRLIHLINRR